MQETKNIFRDKKNNFFDGISYDDFKNLTTKLNSEFAVSNVQIFECASFSMAMVIRSHLGLSAENGNIAIIAKDNFAGCVALATARRLYNAGCNCNIVLLKNQGKDFSKEFEYQAEAVSNLGLELILVSVKENEEELSKLFSSCDNVLMGTYDENSFKDDEINFLSDILNELSTPVHSIFSPHGISDMTGEKLCSSPIFSSSTLSLGLPLKGLSNGNDYAGRHYICEISIPREVAKEIANLPETIFAEQPVCQIFKN